MPWRIAESDLEQVKRQTDLVVVVRSRGIGLTKHGPNDFIGRCPFHDDRHEPNFIVMPQQGLWQCPECGRAGNVIQFVQHHDGVSFRHAFELLRQDGPAALVGARRAAAAGPLKKSTVARLPCPLEAAADDATLRGQVAGYYHTRLKQSGPARAYLARHGLVGDELIDRFQIGFADRTLGLRLPDKNRKPGRRLRARLTELGLWRASGHEHFNGCLVVPLLGAEGQVVSFYGRRTGRDGSAPLYPTGPHYGLFNRDGINQPEVILCDTVFDALTFWVNGFPHVTCRFGREDFPAELAVALRNVQRVRLAYHGGEAGEQAAQRDAEHFQKLGIEVFRIRFPQGRSATESVSPGKAHAAGPSADQALAQLVNSAQWLGPGKLTISMAGPPPAGNDATLMKAAVNEAASPRAQQMEREPAAPGPDHPTIGAAAAAGSMAATAKNPASTGLQQRGEAWFLDLEGRDYRVTGLEKTLGTDALKVGLRLRWGESFHLDQVDLSRDQDRRRFVERAGEETGLSADLLKRDLGKLLLAVEQTQLELLKPKVPPAPVVNLTPAERAAALAWLREPDLIGRLRAAFHQAGIIGEETNTLVAYLAGVSRKLERPLAIIIQSASAAGKTTLMDAVLAFFPEEEQVKYSAMTGQSLFYLGTINLQRKILAVVEEAGAEKATYALKLLQSEGELTIASTGKDPATGRMVTQEYHVAGPVMIFLTTTAIDLDEELQNRCLTLAVDESPEQTGRIHRQQRERRTLAGLIARAERQKVLKILRNAQRLLAPLEVLNPYAPNLTFPTGRTRHRRDHEKYLTLIDAIALLHQHQREIRTLPGQPRYLEVIPADIALANELAPEILGRAQDELPPQTRRLLGHIRELVKPKRRRPQATPRTAATAAGGPTFSRRELRNHCGWSLTQVRVHLARLVELEYLTIRHGRMGSQYVYELALEAESPETGLHGSLMEPMKLGHDYKTNLAGGGKTAPPPLAPLTDKDLNTPDGVADSQISKPSRSLQRNRKLTS
jgi:DNA primase catalytic core